MSNWTKGYDVELLKLFAAPFREHFSEHSYGAFGIPKERDVATALAERNLRYVPRADELVAAVAIIKVAAMRSRQHDFAQRTITIQPGDVQIRHIAGEPAAETQLIEWIAAEHPGAPIWVEAHAERQALIAALKDAGFAYAATKITASSDLKAMWIRGADPEERLAGVLDPADDVTLAELDPAFASPEEVAAAVDEMNAWAPHWEQHYSSYNKRKSWTAVSLRGYDADDPGFIIKPAEMSKQWKEEHPVRMAAACADTPAAALMPTAMKIAARIPGAKDRVRLMQVAPGGGELTRHADITDRDAGTKDGSVCRLHVPLITHPDVRFSAWDISGQFRSHHFPAGSLFYIDIRKPHTVRNDSPISRVHLVIDVYSSPDLRRMLRG